VTSRHVTPTTAVLISTQNGECFTDIGNWQGGTGNVLCCVWHGGIQRK
jgi:hypothetical protein